MLGALHNPVSKLAVVLQVGNYIQHKGGVVTAEELAPFLDVPPAGKDPESIVVDESYVVPALVRFGGSPEVDRDNNLIYRFPSLQKTGRQQVEPFLCSHVSLLLLQEPVIHVLCGIVLNGHICATAVTLSQTSCLL